MKSLQAYMEKKCKMDDESALVARGSRASLSRSAIYLGWQSASLIVIPRFSPGEEREREKKQQQRRPQRRTGLSLPSSARISGKSSPFSRWQSSGPRGCSAALPLSPACSLSLAHPDDIAWPRERERRKGRREQQQRAVAGIAKSIRIFREQTPAADRQIVSTVRDLGIKLYNYNLISVRGVIYFCFFSPCLLLSNRRTVFCGRAFLSRGEGM